ncbi:MAG: polysulfide reductase [Bacteroidetes bacterium GWA2_31_9]|nr:MAG: polysulfide reductase [Bacteroidetes bacterium GWA2_31_9]
MIAAEHVTEMLSKVDGFIYPNELELNWGVLIVLYPYITGLVAGAFILASLERVFKIKALKPTYLIALLSALAFMLVATMPLISHLGQPLRAWEIMITPHLTSAMAIFGFVYLWYLMAVLLVEIWLEYRYDMVIWSQEKKGIMRLIYKMLTLGVNDTSEKSRRMDEKLGGIVTVIGIPSAFLLHGYVGFIFGSIKANPWWSTVLMPIVFLFSAIVSGIAMVMLVYMAISYFRKVKLDMKCLDAVGKYLFYILLIDFVLESLDQVHRIYEAEESFDILHMLVNGKLQYTFLIIQGLIGTIIPLFVLGWLQFYKPNDNLRKTIYGFIGVMVLVGIFFMRWNVVIGGQLFSKSFLGFTTFKLEMIGGEGWLVGLMWMVIPILILIVLLRLLPPWKRAPELEHVD